MDITDAYEITRGLQAAFNEPLDDDPNRFLTWQGPDFEIRMDQYDGDVYLDDGDAVISIPSNQLNRLSQIIGIADRIANDSE